MTVNKLPEYSVQRARFIAAVERKAGALTSYPHPLTGPAGEALYTDVAVFGDPKAPRMMMVISGTHGLEGYYGSDSQINWLESVDISAMPQDTCLLFVHLLNPWGAAHLRRVNEDNIDLNRHFIDFGRSVHQNQAYDKWHSLYSGKRDVSDTALAAALASGNWPEIKQVVEAGQYHHPDGLFYGGNKEAWSNLTMQKIIAGHLSQAKLILSFDLHTGAGAWGHPMLLSIASQTRPAHEWGKNIYAEWLTVLITGAGQNSDTGVTATATGYLSQYLLDKLPDCHILPLVVECGTYPGNQMHQWVRDDHWLYIAGSPDSAEGKQVKETLIEAFYPADADWRELIALRTQQIFKRGWRALIDTPVAHKRP